MIHRVLPLLAIVILLGGCETAPTMLDGRPGFQIFPSVKNCVGEMNATITLPTGRAAVMHMDCGDGFTLIHE